MLARLASVATLLFLGACTTAPTPPATSSSEPGVLDVPPPAEDRQLSFQLASGTYRCDMGQRVEVQRSADDANLIQISWTGKRYRLARNPSHSGLPRFEDSGSGLVWIDLPWKSILLDGESNKPLASDCKIS